MGNCHQCGEEYPDYFPECPGCGASKPTPPPKAPIDFKKGIRGLVWLIIIGFILFSFVSYKINAPSRELAARQEKEQRAATARAAAEKRAAENAERDRANAKERAAAIATQSAQQRVLDEKKAALSELRSRFRLNRTSINTMAVEVALVNNSSLGMKDFSVSCDLKGQSGSTIKTETVIIYRQLMPGQSFQTEPLSLGFINPQVTTGECRVVDAKF